MNPRGLLALVVVVVIAGGFALVAEGGNGNSNGSKTATTRSTSASSEFRASGVASPSRQAPPLQLRNYLGRRVNIDQYRGKVVLVTFLYTNCPDVCPLITANLHAALGLMGPQEAKKVQIIAVSVDPHGDTPKAVGAFLARHEMTGRMQYLIGSAHELARVWKAWGVGSEKDAEQPQFINHSGLIYGLDPAGKQLTIYAANFKPSDIVHDVPLLASQ
jgi:protein SCO1/2